MLRSFKERVQRAICTDERRDVFLLYDIFLVFTFGPSSGLPETLYEFVSLKLFFQLQKAFV
jgi:hypothetical protein